MKTLLSTVAILALASAVSTPAVAKHRIVHHRKHHALHHAHYVYRAHVASREALPPPPPPAPPPTFIHFHGGAVGFIVGVGGGDGVVEFHGARYPIEVSGLKVGTIGISSYNVDGRVLHLSRLEDIEGTYSAGEASATAGVGAGDLDMSNDKGVEIQAHSTSGGLQLTLAAGGVTIRLKR